MGFDIGITMPEEEFCIPGLGKRTKHPTAKYIYDDSSCDCPVCGGLGTPWMGWFSCDECPAVALVSSGEVFVPLQRMK